MKKLVAMLASLCIIATMTACAGPDAQQGAGSSPGASQPDGSDGADPAPAASSGDSLTIRYADVQAENDSETMFAREFARLVSEKSDGRITVEVYPNGSMGEMADILSSVQMGAVEMCRTNPSWLADAGAPSMNLLTLPFLFSDNDHSNRVLEGEVGARILQELTDNSLGVKGLGYLQASGRYFFFTKKEVSTLDDITGLKIRVPTNSLATSMVDNLGASATPISYSELYSSLQTNIVEGADNPLKGILNMSFYEVSSYILDMAHQYEASVVLMSEGFWNKLSAEDQAIVQEAMNEGAAYFKDLDDSNLASYRADLEANGIAFVAPANPQEWMDAVQPTIQEFGAGYEDLLEQIEALR